MRRSPWLRSRLSGLLTLAAFTLPGAAFAQQAARSDVPDEEEASVVSAKAAADPGTGRVRPPTRDEIRELSEKVGKMLDRSGPQPPAVKTPSGAVRVELDERFDAVSIARVAQGKPEAFCASSKEEAKAFLEGKKAPPAKPSTQPLEER